jgi:hypothetical protein
MCMEILATVCSAAGHKKFFVNKLMFLTFNDILTMQGRCILTVYTNKTSLAKDFHVKRYVHRDPR